MSTTKLKPLTLPQALRKGAQTVKPQHGLYYDRDRPGAPVGCAVGALAYGLGEVNGKGSFVDKDLLRAHYPALTDGVAHCPLGCDPSSFMWNAETEQEYGQHRPDVLSTIEHLFEFHHRTFPQIAAWLSKYSPQAATVVAREGERRQVRKALGKKKP